MNERLLRFYCGTSLFKFHCCFFFREMGLDEGEEALKKMIMQRSEQRAKESDAFLDQLAAKYGGGGGGAKKGKAKKK